MKKSASIVCIGNWNTKIFTPQWVLSKLYSIPEGETMNMNINKDNLNLSFIWKDFSFFPTEKSVEIKMSNVDQSVLNQAEILFAKLIDYLPHTPIEAFGYNIRIDFNKEEFLATRLKDFTNINIIDKYNTTSISVQSLEKQDYSKTILIEFKEDSVGVTFNIEFKNILLAKPDEYRKYDMLNKEVLKVLGDEYGIS